MQVIGNASSEIDVGRILTQPRMPCQYDRKLQIYFQVTKELRINFKQLEASNIEIEQSIRL